LSQSNGGVTHSRLLLPCQFIQHFRLEHLRRTSPATGQRRVPSLMPNIPMVSLYSKTLFYENKMYLNFLGSHKKKLSSHSNLIYPKPRIGGYLGQPLLVKDFICKHCYVSMLALRIGFDKQFKQLEIYVK